VLAPLSMLSRRDLIRHDNRQCIDPTTENVLSCHVTLHYDFVSKKQGPGPDHTPHSSMIPLFLHAM